MLPTDLLVNRFSGDEITPKKLALSEANLAIARELIGIFEDYRSGTQGDLNRQLQEIEGEETDYRLKRGLAHLLRSGFSTFEIVSPLEPQDLRKRVFALASEAAPLPQTRTQTLERLAQSLSHELGHEVLTSQIQLGLYADLNENRILTEFEAPEPEALIHRYNLSQAQGIFYKAHQIIINAHRNDPGEYKLLFRYLKLFGLMAYIEGDADHGFTITIDGPTSLFKTSTRYGIDIAKLIPALLHVTRWSLKAELHMRDRYSDTIKIRYFSLDSDCDLVTHYPPGKTYDSMLEESFVDRWRSHKTEWRLEREVDLVPIPGSVMIPDFRLVHPNGQTYLLEIVGYWRPEYLRKKFSQVRQSGRDDLILAVSERLNLEKAGVKIADTPAKIVWFKHKLSPKVVLQVLEDS
ncbi:MAG: DUF790 family protein [Elainellaceae cyanobacterium]